MIKWKSILEDMVLVGAVVGGGQGSHIIDVTPRCISASIDSDPSIAANSAVMDPADQTRLFCVLSH